MAPPRRRSSGRKGSLSSMPPEVTELGGAWPSLVGGIPGLTEELEQEFRFGHKVGVFGDSFRLGGSIKGGSSAIWAPATDGQYRAYLAWRDREAIADTDDPAAYGQLLELLAANSIRFCDQTYTEGSSGNGPRPGRGRLYRLVLEVLRSVPGSHLRRESFAELHLGGWGPDSAKASAYANGAVHLYDFAVSGAERTFLGLMLHELGHAHGASLGRAEYQALVEDHAEVAEAFEFLGVEFLLDAESRKVYQQFLVDEFLAETYLVYSSQGGRLRRFIADQTQPAVRNAWEEVYAIFKRTFEGVEYS